WAVVVRRDGLVDGVAEVTAPSSSEVRVVMEVAATLAGILRSEDGKALAGAAVVLEPGADVATARTTMLDSGPASRRPSEEHRFLRHTDASGVFRFPGVPEGSYSIAVVLPAAAPQRAHEVRFGPLRPSGGPYELSVAAPLANALAGRVVDA